MLLDVYGTGYFFSLNNSYLSSLFRELGQNTPVEYDYRGLQNRTPLETVVRREIRPLRTGFHRGAARLI